MIHFKYMKVIKKIAFPYKFMDILFGGYMTSAKLKTIALICMLIDHSAYLVAPFNSTIYFYMRLIGRIAFPIFIFIISESLYYTRSKNKFLMRLFIFSIISEFSFNLYFNYLNGSAPVFGSHNVFFTFSFAVLFIIMIEEICKNKKLLIPLFCVILLGFVYSSVNYIFIYFYNFILNSDYGFYGVIFLMALFHERKISIDNHMKIRMMTIFLMCFLLYGVSMYFVFAIFSLALIYMYNGEKGRGHKYFFYLFYPVHLLILSFIYVLLF